MKKLILLALTAIMMAGCVEVEHQKNADVRGCEILVIDSCEYVRVLYTSFFAHKGNCKYCAERRKQELKELVKELRGN